MAGQGDAGSEAVWISREQSLGFVVNRVARLYARALEERLAAHGVALAQFATLLILWERDGLTQSEIARRLALEQPTIANTLSRMERDGLISTAPDPSHRRQILISLTEKARALKRPLTTEAMRVNAHATAVFGAGEIETLFQLLNRLRAQLGGAKDPLPD
jgi:DNA-binding MarR family transcriptional regulator